MKFWALPHLTSSEHYHHWSPPHLDTTTSDQYHNQPLSHPEHYHTWSPPLLTTTTPEHYHTWPRLTTTTTDHLHSWPLPLPDHYHTWPLLTTNTSTDYPVHVSVIFWDFSLLLPNNVSSSINLNKLISVVIQLRSEAKSIKWGRHSGGRNENNSPWISLPNPRIVAQNTSFTSQGGVPITVPHSWPSVWLVWIIEIVVYT